MHTVHMHDGAVGQQPSLTLSGLGLICKLLQPKRTLLATSASSTAPAVLCSVQPWDVSPVMCW